MSAPTKPTDDTARQRSRDVHAWHVAINRFHDGKEHRSWMYEANTVFSEVPRLIRLFGIERRKELPQTHQQCSQQEPVPVEDNRLTCCLGVECRNCPELLALEKAEVSPERLDEIKAWTCATHIISKGGDMAREGYVLTTSDQMFWANTYASLASGLDGGDEP